MLNLYTVVSQSGHEMHEVPAFSETEAMEKVNELAGKLGVDDPSIEAFLTDENVDSSLNTSAQDAFESIMFSRLLFNLDTLPEGDSDDYSDEY